MTPVFAARRRAEEFASLVEAPSNRGSGDARYDDLLRVVGTLRDADPVTARPEFVADLRERLLTAADTVLVPSGTTKVPTETDRLTLPPRRSARERRIAAVVGGLALVGATTSMAVAAQDALPGEALYPVKRDGERPDRPPVLRGRQGRHPAGQRQRPTRRGRRAERERQRRGHDRHRGHARHVHRQASEASDLLLADYADNDNQASVSELRDFTAQSLDQLTALEPQVPDDARDELVRAARVLLDIDAAAQQACPICGGRGSPRSRGSSRAPSPTSRSRPRRSRPRRARPRRARPRRLPTRRSPAARHRRRNRPAGRRCPRSSPRSCPRAASRSRRRRRLRPTASRRRRRERRPHRRADRPARERRVDWDLEPQAGPDPHRIRGRGGRGHGRRSTTSSTALATRWTTRSTTRWTRSPARSCPDPVPDRDQRKTDSRFISNE